MSETRTYFQCGLRVASTIELALPTVPPGKPDLVVRWGDDTLQSAELPPGQQLVAYDNPDGSRWYTGSRTDRGYMMRFRDCGECVISAGLDEVVVRRDPNGRHEILPILVAGTVSSFLLALRGHTVLHASAVAVDGAGVAFVGQSGRGKSTVAALMCADRAELITDDVLVVEPGPPAACVGGAPELRLREKAFGLAKAVEGATTRETEDDRLAFAPTSAALRPFPLRAIVIPSPTHESLDIRVETIPPSDAVFAMLQFPRVYGWSDPEVLTREFATLSALVNEVPVYNVTIPWGPPFSQEIAPAIADLVRG